MGHERLRWGWTCAGCGDDYPPCPPDPTEPEIDIPGDGPLYCWPCHASHGYGDRTARPGTRCFSVGCRKPARFLLADGQRYACTVHARATICARAWADALRPLVRSLLDDCACPTCPDCDGTGIHKAPHSRYADLPCQTCLSTGRPLDPTTRCFACRVAYALNPTQVTSART